MKTRKIAGPDRLLIDILMEILASVLLIVYKELMSPEHFFPHFTEAYILNFILTSGKRTDIPCSC